MSERTDTTIEIKAGLSVVLISHWLGVVRSLTEAELQAGLGISTEERDVVCWAVEKFVAPFGPRMLILASDGPDGTFGRPSPVVVAMRHIEHMAQDADGVRDPGYMMLLDRLVRSDDQSPTTSVTQMMFPTCTDPDAPLFGYVHVCFWETDPDAEEWVDCTVDPHKTVTPMRMRKRVHIVPELFADTLIKHVTEKWIT